MQTPAQQLDKRFIAFAPLANALRPEKGWIKAVREALGMTTAQLGKRLGVSQQRAAMVEKAEVDGSITLKSLEQAAQTLGCRVVYVLYPEEPLTQTLRARAEAVADQQMLAVEQTMRLEDQSVADSNLRLETRDRLMEQLLKRPARLWDHP
jgi:predicted DNA-binding mobile mystery protein A